MRSLYAYIRVSTIKQGEKGSSLQEQRAAIEAYATRHALTISEWFEEKETAAKRGRRDFSRMLRALARGGATGVIIHKVDRSARNLRDWADLGELIDRGVEVHFAHEKLDLTSRSGRLSADIQAVVAADFIRNLRDEVRKGLRGRLKQGLYPRPAPVGYQDNGCGQPKTPDPIAAPLVRLAFELYATGDYNLRTLGQELYKRGLRNLRGGQVTRTGLSNILNNPFYFGLIAIKRTNETFPGVHEPLITKALFDEVQARLQGKHTNRGLKHHYNYRRFIRCASCMHNIIGERQKGTVYYRCHCQDCPTLCVREDWLDQAIGESLQRITLMPQDLEELEYNFNHAFKDRRAQLADTQKGHELQIAQINDKIARLTDAYIDRVLDKELFEERKRSLLTERVALQEYLTELKDGNDPSVADAKDYLELLRALPGKDFLNNPDETKQILETVTSNRLIRQNTLEIQWLEPFETVATRDLQLCGAPHRATPRKPVRDVSYGDYDTPQWIGKVIQYFIKGKTFDDNASV